MSWKYAFRRSAVFYWKWRKNKKCHKCHFKRRMNTFRKFIHFKYLPKQKIWIAFSWWLLETNCVSITLHNTAFFKYEMNTLFFCGKFKKGLENAKILKDCKNGRMAKMRSGLLDAFSSFFLNGLLSVRDFKGLWDSEVTLNFFLLLLI